MNAFRSGNPYASIGDESDFSFLTEERLNVFRKGSKRNTYSFEEIESIAYELLRYRWKTRDTLFGERTAMDVINPSKVLELQGFECDFSETLGQFRLNGKTHEVAGIIDQNNSKVFMSRQFDKKVQRFTLAHELGHAVLHLDSGLHRDRALDGSSLSMDRTEKEADKFAVCFLMPEKLVKEKFSECFLCDKFILDDNNVYALDPLNKFGLKEKKKYVRDISLILADAISFNGANFTSLSNFFGVSKTAIAIRLEELDLVTS